MLLGERNTSRCGGAAKRFSSADAHQDIMSATIPLLTSTSVTPRNHVHTLKSYRTVRRRRPRCPCARGSSADDSSSSGTARNATHKPRKLVIFSVNDGAFCATVLIIVKGIARLVRQARLTFARHPSSFSSPFARAVYELKNLSALSCFIRDRIEPGDAFICTLNGDFLSPSLLSSLDGGAAAVSVMNAVPITHVCLGNHEFDHSVETLGRRLKGTRRDSCTSTHFSCQSALQRCATLHLTLVARHAPKNRSSRRCGEQQRREYAG